MLELETMVSRNYNIILDKNNFLDRDKQQLICFYQFL